MKKITSLNRPWHKWFLVAAICSICTQAHSQWSLTGNAGTVPGTNFIGTTDSKSFYIKTKNSTRIAINSSGRVGIGTTAPVFKLDVKGGSINTDSVYRIGGNAVLSVSGSGNTFVGIGNGYSNTSGSSNTTNGYNAFYSNTTGYWNTVSGAGALYFNTTGALNTAFGVNALYANSVGHSNTACGTSALVFNSTGYFNTALGRDALSYNNSGYSNTAGGYQTLYNNTIGSYNTANGSNSLFYNTSGNYNTATGNVSLYLNSTGTGNTASGHYAMYSNSTGSYNSSLGYGAGCNPNQNPSNFTAIGYNAGHAGGNSNTIEIGNTSITWISGQVGWSLHSDKRIKDNIQSNVPGLSFITKLNPVTYNLNIHKQHEICGIIDTNEWEGKYDIEKIVQTGFLAQEVEQAAKECNYDFNGVRAPIGNAKLYSVQYSSFVMPLVKAVQELNKTNEELKIKNAKLENKVEAIEKVLSSEQKLQLGINNYVSKGQAILFQNNPNPFNQTTVIRYALSSEHTSGVIVIRDLSGNLVKSIVINNTGRGQVTINAKEFTQGTYTYSLEVAGESVDTKLMVITK